jgi:OmpA-OmpF porin, OOP family
MNKFFRLLLVFILIIVVSSPLISQQNEIKTRVFKDVDDAFIKARTEQADVLSPSIYQQAVKKNEQAINSFDKGKAPDEIIEETLSLLKTAVENAKLAKVTFPHTLSARNDALKASAPQLALEIYTKSERELTEAAKSVEKGDIKKAKEQGLRAEKLFRDAELGGIKLSVLGDVKQQLAVAQKTEIPKYAPQTLARAAKLAEQAEDLLNRDRNAISDARTYVEDAAYELRHAAYILKRALELKDDQTNWEALILEHEAAVSQVIKELNYSPQFDQGLEKACASLITAINSMKQENRKLNDDLTELSTQNETLQDQVEQTRSELNASKEIQAGLKARIDSDQKKEEKYKRVEELFLPQEAKVLRIGNEVTLRLVGLNFPSGRAFIDPMYFSLLAKVQRAIRIFPEVDVVVEGHTDAVGDDKNNEKLSLERANAVRAYILASMGLPNNKVKAIGFGEAKPIASNDSNPGRQQNRRIDVVLKPQASK